MYLIVFRAFDRTQNGLFLCGNAVGLQYARHVYQLKYEILILVMMLSHKYCCCGQVVCKFGEEDCLLKYDSRVDIQQSSDYTVRYVML